MSDQGVINKLANFIRREVLTDKASGRVVRFELRHMPVGAKQGQSVLPLDVPEELPDSWIENCASDIMAAALSDAEGISQGTQRYVVYSFRAKSPDRPSGTRHSFFIAAADNDEEGALESEPPSKGGLVAQTMRHLEATQKILLTSLAPLMNANARMAEVLGRENEKLREDRYKSFETLEVLITERTAREIDQAKAQASIENMRELTKSVKLLAPAVINRLSGGQVDTSKESLAQIIGGLSQEKQVKLLSAIDSADVFDTSEKIALAELLRQAASNKEKEN